MADSFDSQIIDTKVLGPHVGDGHRLAGSAADGPSPVVQLGSDKWDADVWSLPWSDGMTYTRVALVDEQRGRHSVTVTVDATSTSGIVVAPTAAQVRAGIGKKIPAGGGFTFNTRGPVFIGLQVVTGAATGDYEVEYDVTG